MMMDHFVIFGTYCENAISKRTPFRDEHLSRLSKLKEEGIGSMSGYKDVLGEKGDEIIANWIWEQSQNAWIQG